VGPFCRRRYSQALCRVHRHLGSASTTCRVSANRCRRVNLLCNLSNRMAHAAGRRVTPAGTSPSVTIRQNAISNFRASATIIFVLRAPCAVRAWYQHDTRCGPHDQPVSPVVEPPACVVGVGRRLFQCCVGGDHLPRIRSWPMLKCSSERCVCAPHSLPAGTPPRPGCRSPCELGDIGGARQGSSRARRAYNFRCTNHQDHPGGITICWPPPTASGSEA
jgi:hypothetical protein